MNLNALSKDCGEILRLVRNVYRVNAEAEVSEIQLQKELDLPPSVVRSCLARLVSQGFVEADLLLAHAWVRATDSGLTTTGRG